MVGIKGFEMPNDCIELRHNPSELVELLEEQYKSGEISPIVISESLITLFRMLEEKRMVESEGQE